MCILLLFNSTDQMSYRDIAAATDIPASDLKRNLQSLACVKARARAVDKRPVPLHREGSTSAPLVGRLTAAAMTSLAAARPAAQGKNVLRKEPMGKDIEETDTFAFNDKFTSKLHKVKIGTVLAQKENEPEKAETRQRIEDDRKPQIEAAVVRIMKARRVLDHNSLIAEVTKQLSSRFCANPAVIKKRIESLIEREFLERGARARAARGSPAASETVGVGALHESYSGCLPPPARRRGGQENLPVLGIGAQGVCRTTWARGGAASGTGRRAQ